MKRGRRNHLKAHSLAYVLIISVLLFAFLSSMIIKDQLYWKIDRHHIEAKQSLDNVVSGIHVYLGRGLQEDSIQLDLFTDGKDMVTLTKRPWGLLDVLSSTTSSETHSAKSSVFIGSSVLEEHRYTLTLSDRNAPLSLGGRTEIIGPVRLPEAGVKRAYIEGTTFQGERLVNGAIEQSASELPQISSIIRHRVNTYRSMSGVESEPFEVLDSLVVPFTSKPRMLHSDGAIFLSDTYLAGQIAISSLQKITVLPSAILKDVILIAPQIEILSGFKGSLQAFGSRSIQVKEGVELENSTVLILDAEFDEDGIHVADGSYVNGQILDISSPIVNSLVQVDEADVKGVIYAANRLQLGGEVRGAVYCDEFYLKTPSSVYGNHLLNASILRLDDSSDLTLPPLFSHSSNRVLRWVD